MRIERNIWDGYNNKTIRGVRNETQRKPKQNTEKYEFRSKRAVETKDGGFNEMK